MSSTPGDSNLNVPRLTKPVYRWKLPETARQYVADPASFAIEAWSVGQALDANRVAAKNGTILEHEIFQRACVEIDGKPVDQAMNLLDNWSPKAVAFVVKAVNVVGVPSADEDRVFLDSMTIS